MERFAQRAPLPVMAILILQQVLGQDWVNALFEQYRQSQYTRELLFSTTMDIMSVVAMGLRPSLHAAAKAYLDLPVSITALYDKINHTDPAVIRALIQCSHERLAPVLQSMRPEPVVTVEGYRLRIVDGNHLPASEKRLKPLRQFRGAALPGHSLVAYDQDIDMVTDLHPCADAHVQERACMGPILERAHAGELWIADRNFCTRATLTSLHERGSAFIREHGRTPNPTACAAPHTISRIDTGIVSEQPVSLPGEPDAPRCLRANGRWQYRSPAPDESA